MLDFIMVLCGIAVIFVIVFLRARGAHYKHNYRQLISESGAVQMLRANCPCNCHVQPSSYQYMGLQEHENCAQCYVELLRESDEMLNKECECSAALTAQMTTLRMEKRILDHMTDGEGNQLLIVHQNPDFGGENQAITVYRNFEEQKTYYGDSRLAVLRQIGKDYEFLEDVDDQHTADCCSGDCRDCGDGDHDAAEQDKGSDQ